MIKRHFSPANLLGTVCVTLLSLALGLNLVNFYWIDFIFILATLLGLLKMSRESSKGFSTTFGIEQNPFIYFCALYFLSGVIGYILHSPMQQREWVEIFSIRWIWGFFAFYFLGLQSQKIVKSTQFLFIPLTAVLLYILYKHQLLTSGKIITPELRLQGLYENPNHLALALAVMWGFVAGCTFLHGKTKKLTLFSFCALAIVTITLISTYSRTSWIGVIAVTIVGLTYSKSKKGLTAALVFLILASAAFHYNFFGIKDRILDLSRTDSQFARLTVWKVAWQIFIDHPTFGVGFEQNVRLYPEYYIKAGYPSEYVIGHAHNQFLEVMTGTGILGLIGYLGAFTSGFIFFNRRFKAAVETHTKQIALGALLAIVALFASSFTDAPFRLHEVRNYVLILLGFSFGFLNTNYKSPANEKD